MRYLIINVCIAIVAMLCVGSLYSRPLDSTTGQSAPIKLIRTSGFEVFLSQLNELGKRGFRLEKSVSSGEAGPSQNFAGVMRLYPDSAYEYDWMSSPDKNLLESRLNARAKDGFFFVNAFTLTSCGDAGVEGDPNPGTLVLRLQKGDAFLLARNRNSSGPVKEYKVIIGKIGLGKSPTEAIQTSLNNLPAGFRPVKILFRKTGVTDFAISVLLERNLNDSNPSKIEYKFIKEVNGFEKSINNLAGEGFRILSGRRIGLIKMALMAKETSESVVYSLIDEEKYAKQFDETVSHGNRFEKILEGDVDCDSSKRVNEKLLFTQIPPGKKIDYKILSLNGSSDAEVDKQLAEGYDICDLFFYQGLNVIFEKWTVK